MFVRKLSTRLQFAHCLGQMTLSIHRERKFKVKYGVSTISRVSGDWILSPRPICILSQANGNDLKIRWNTGTTVNGKAKFLQVVNRLHHYCQISDINFLLRSFCVRGENFWLSTWRYVENDKFPITNFASRACPLKFN